MTLSEEEINKLYLIQRTLMQMLKDRGYLIEDSEITMTKEEFIRKYGEDKMERQDLVTLKAKRNNENDQLYVFFPDEEEFDVEVLTEYTKRLNLEKVNRAIFVVQRKLNKYVLAGIKLMSLKFDLEVFQEEELLANVKEHAFVPVHQALTTEEKKTLLEKYTVKETQLPRIRFTDPIARYYGLKRGQVVKIIRPSETVGWYVTYRYVI